MTEDIAIENWDHFVNLTKDFNKKNKTATYLLFDTIDSINKKYQIIDVENLHFYYKSLIDNAFAKSDKFASSDISQNNSFYFLNNIVTFKKSFQQFGYQILNPINIHYTEKKIFVHPGQFRINLLAKHYSKKIPFIITDYTQTLPRLGLAKFNFNPNFHRYRLINNHWLDKFNQHKLYQEVYSNDNNFLDKSFGHLDKLNEHREFVKIKNNIYCNGELILFFDNNIWQPNLEEFL